MVIPEEAYLAYAAATAFYLALGAIHWVLGRRYSALQYFEDALMVMVYIFVVLLIEDLVYEVSSYMGVRFPGNGVEKDLLAAASIFDNAREFAIKWILAISSFRAALSLTPITSPLSYVLGSATSWSMTVFDICAINFLFYSAVTKVFSEYYPVILSIGAVLTPIPRLRNIGGSLLSVAMVYTPTLLYYAHLVQASLSTLPQPPSINPVDWVNIAALASDAAIPLAELFVRGLVAVSLAGIVAAGLSRILSGMYTYMRLGV